MWLFPRVQFDSPPHRFDLPPHEFDLPPHEFDLPPFRCSQFSCILGSKSKYSTLFHQVWSSNGLYQKSMKIIKNVWESWKNWWNHQNSMKIIKNHQKSSEMYENPDFPWKKHENWWKALKQQTINNHLRQVTDFDAL